MDVRQAFKTVLSYAASMEGWVNSNLPTPLQYTFVSDFAIADWFGKDSVDETYERVKKEWLDDYVAFTEVVVALNMLSWANDALKRQGYDGREDFIRVYAGMYHRACKDFYDKYSGNQEACDHFFRMTD